MSNIEVGEMRVRGLLIACGVWAALLGCGEEKDRAPGVMLDDQDEDGGGLVCVDEDDDGAGDGCDTRDCDDDDPDITDECYRCRNPSEGCPCEAGTSPTYCEPDELGDQIQRDGQVLTCTDGARYCRQHEELDGDWLWTACEGIYTAVLSN